MIFAVQHYGYDLTVGILEGNGFNFLAPFAASDSLCAALDVFAEMTDVVIGIVNINLAGLRVDHNGSIAKISDVVRSAVLPSKCAKRHSKT